MFDIVNPAVFGAAIAAGLFVGILAALALGRWVGRRAIAQAPSTLPPNIGSLESAVFALLGLLIAFTFSGALTRFDVRRAWKASKLEHEEISRYAFCAGSHTSRS